MDKSLIDFILKNNLYFGGLNLNSDLKKFIWKLNKKKKSSLFNIYDQVWLLKRFYNLLQYNVRVKKKPILFFGVNKLGLESSNFSKIDFVNKKIFKLCFTIVDTNSYNISIIKKKLNNFFINNFSINFLKKINFMENFKLFEKDILFLINNNKIRLNGFFFNNWVGGVFSNYPFIKTRIKNFVENSLFTGSTFINLKKLSFRNKFISLYSNYNAISNLNENHSPGLVIFFSKFGYDSFIKEFKKMGVPVVCIVGEKESLDYIDYPLLGDNSNINTVLFYCHLIEEFLKQEKLYEANN